MGLAPNLNSEMIHKHVRSELAGRLCRRRPHMHDPQHHKENAHVWLAGLGWVGLDSFLNNKGEVSIVDR